MLVGLLATIDACLFVILLVLALPLLTAKRRARRDLHLLAAEIRGYFRGVLVGRRERYQLALAPVRRS